MTVTGQGGRARDRGRTEVVGLLMWERRHAVRAVLPGRTLCGIRTGLASVDDVPGLTDFAGSGEAGFCPCRRCLPMWRRVVDLKRQVSRREDTGDTRTYRDVSTLMGRWGATA